MGLREWLGIAPQPTKAIVGTGAYWMEHGVPLRNISRDPAKRIAEALRLYTSNDHVYACESTIGEKFVSVPWHLERDGETIEDTDSAARDCYNLLRYGSIDPDRYPPLQSRTDQWLMTSRHMGLPGTAFWVLDQQDDRGIPARTMVITPARMTPSETKRGTLQGWIVDADRPNEVEPVPLELSEVIRFTLEPDDFGHFGIGKAQAVWRKAGLSNATAGFTEGTMLSGGRKAHMIWPDGVTVEGETWDAWVNNLRNVNEDGSFTRRLTANRFPVGSLETGQTLAELQIPDISKLSQEDIYAVWKMPISQTGRQSAAGLNSGEKGKFEEAALWQNAVEPRLNRFAEPIQTTLVDPFGLTLVLEVPTFDDELPQYEVAEKARYVPSKVDERRSMVGLDPLDETVYGKLGQAILIDQSLIELSEKQAIPDNLIPFQPREQGRDDDEAEMPHPGEVSGKARLNMAALHAGISKRYEPLLTERIGEVLKAQASAIAAEVKQRHGHLQGKPNDLDAWWHEEREHQRLSNALSPIVTKIIGDVGQRTRATFVFPAKADWREAVAEYVNRRVGDRIRTINTTTRDALRTLIADGVREGLSPAELGQRITEATQFDEARAEMIARTETGYAYNDTAIGTYRAFDVEEVDVIDGDADDICAPVNGARWTLEEASANPLGHPNCTRDFVPVVKASRAGTPRLRISQRYLRFCHSLI